MPYTNYLISTELTFNAVAIKVEDSNNGALTAPVSNGRSAPNHNLPCHS